MSRILDYRFGKEWSVVSGQNKNSTPMKRMGRIGADYIGIRKMFMISIPPYYLE
jgi:hypothetical protein